MKNLLKSFKFKTFVNTFLIYKQILYKVCNDKFNLHAGIAFPPIYVATICVSLENYGTFNAISTVPK